MITAKKPYALLLFQTQSDVQLFKEALRYVLSKHDGDAAEHRRERLAIRDALAALPEIKRK